MRRTTVGLLLLLHLMACIVAGADKPRPNVVVVLADDLGYADLSCYGARDIATPHIDSLAQAGVRLTSFYCPSSVCSPSRAALLTGRHPSRYGITAALTHEQKMGQGLPAREVLLPKALKAAGYATGAFGKWHLGFGQGSRPTDRGFDTFFGSPGGGIYTYTDKAYEPFLGLFRDGDQVKTSGYSTELFTQAAIDFIRQHATHASTTPFFIYLAFNAPHFALPGGEPYAPQAYLDRFARFGPKRRDYLAATAAMDDAVGRVLVALKELRLDDSTIVIFCSDNGGEVKYGASNRPWRAGKTTLFEGGIRVPCVIRWPGMLAANNTIDTPLNLMDLFPLLTGIAGVDAKSIPNPLDGQDPLPALRKGAASPHAVMHFVVGKKWAVRQGEHKLVERQLFNLATDPGETRDLAAEQAERVLRLTEAHEAWRKRIGNNQ